MPQSEVFGFIKSATRRHYDWKQQALLHKKSDSFENKNVKKN
jgi:hypothetical protein